VCILFVFFWFFFCFFWGLFCSDNNKFPAKLNCSSTCAREPAGKARNHDSPTSRVRSIIIETEGNNSYGGPCSACCGTTQKIDPQIYTLLCKHQHVWCLAKVSKNYPTTNDLICCCCSIVVAKILMMLQYTWFDLVGFFCLVQSL
jgi:hypothetical protein